MVLNLIPLPDESDPLRPFQDDIVLLATDPPPRLPAMGEWSADQQEQTITHVASGLRFRAFPTQKPRDGGIIPFNRPYDIGLKLVDYPKATGLPERARVYEIAWQGIRWIKTYTYEAKR